MMADENHARAASEPVDWQYPFVLLSPYPYVAYSSTIYIVCNSPPIDSWSHRFCEKHSPKGRQELPKGRQELGYCSVKGDIQHRGNLNRGWRFRDEGQLKLSPCICSNS
jgi:hypothetical protein